MELSCTFIGSQDAPALVLLGSLGSTRAMWDGLIPHLSEYRVVAMDLRGHGDSPWATGEWTMAELAEDVTDTLDAAGIDRAYVAGISLGGMITLQLAHDAPSRVRAAAVCDSTTGPLARDVWDERVRAVRAGELAQLAPAIASRWVTPAGRDRDPDMYERLLTSLASTPIEGYAGCAAAVRDFDLSGHVDTITTPTIVICGQLDESLPLEHSRRVHLGIPGAELVVLPGLAHLPAVEDPAAFAAPLREFFARH